MISIVSKSSISSLSSYSSKSSISSSSLSSDSSSSNSSFSSSSNSSSSNSSTSSSSNSSSSNSSSSNSSFSSSSSLTDCIDWKITEALLAQLSTMSSGYNTKINTVRLMETDYKDTLNPPMLIICPNEVDPNNEYLSRSDNLPFALIYIDNSNDKNLHYRFRHIAPDIQRCLKKNPTMNDLAQVVKVLNWESSVFVIENIEITCCVVYINVERTLDTDNPYKLS